jgi:hypothetical protein
LRNAARASPIVRAWGRRAATIVNAGDGDQRREEQT